MEFLVLNLFFPHVGPARHCGLAGRPHIILMRGLGRQKDPGGGRRSGKVTGLASANDFQLVSKGFNPGQCLDGN